MTKAWTDDVARYLQNDDFCPRCDARLTEQEWCANCGADLHGEQAASVRLASRQASDALRVREDLLALLPSRPQPRVALVAAATTPEPVVAVAATGPAAATAAAAATAPQSSVSVQSVLAVAGAALVAVAAIVFTFLNPDLTDFTTRSLIVGAVTVAFLGSAWLLVRAGLQFSAEAVGALGMVFVVLDIWAVSTLAPQLSGWVFAGIGTVVAAGLMVLVAWLARIRTWLWGGLAGLAISPAFFAYAADNPWITIVGHVAVGFAALAVHDAVRALGPRFGNALRADRVTATVLQLAAAGIVLVSVPTLFPRSPAEWLGASAVLLAIAVLAAASTRHQLPRLWSGLAGVFFASAVGLVPFAIPNLDPVWLVALVPAAAALAVGALGALPATASVRRIALLAGAWSLALMAAVPAVLVAMGRIVLPLAVSEFGGGDDPIDLAALLGVAAAAVGSAMLWLLARRREQTAVLARGAMPTSLWLGMLALLALADWEVLPTPARVALGLALALCLGLAVALFPRLAHAPLRVRVPLVVAAHPLLLSAAALAWTDSNLTVAGGALGVLVLAVLARTVPPVIRPLYLAVGYGYALIVFAAGLTLVHVETIAVLCLTTTLGSVVALVATLVRRLPARAWYAVLIVTAVPFVIGIGSVLAERSGWTALSTGVTFLLALTLLVTTRPGLNRIVRAMAAALLVPTLAVVIVCLGAQFLAISGSPVVLPIIAVLVACTLPSTGLIRAALERRGIPIAHAEAARIWIEVSTLVTGALAVLLALLREAAGLGTSSLVLLILGLGAAAMARFAHRRYGWVLAFVSWTGALWCVWALAGVTVAEPYILPSALVAAVVGAVLVARGRPGIGIPAVGLFAAGLTSAVVPSLALAAVAGAGRDGTDIWRVLALVAAAVVLLVLGALVRRLSPESRFALLARLRVPLLLVSVAAASAGSVQAVRWGLGLDPVSIAPSSLMWPVLAISAGSAVLAALAGRLLLGTARSGAPGVGGRWVYAPASVLLAVGPIAATRPMALPIFALYVLGFGFLGLMIVTVVRARTRAVTLPPVWFTFAVAWCVMVASWSTREILRVEAYSLPLGLALLAVGVIAMRPAIVPVRAGWTSWPLGFRGSWRLLAPGIVVTLLASIFATGTDPQTWRAILVLALALASILIGSLRRLGAPFVIGLVVLPIENIVVFAVQLGRSIGATPWWITLATAGAVLLVIAATSERRSAGQKGMAARLRDLR